MWGPLVGERTISPVTRVAPLPRRRSSVPWDSASFRGGQTGLRTPLPRCCLRLSASAASLIPSPTFIPDELLRSTISCSSIPRDPLLPQCSVLGLRPRRRWHLHGSTRDLRSLTSGRMTERRQRLPSRSTASQPAYLNLPTACAPTQASKLVICLTATS